MNIKDKIILVTGSSKGIGAAIAKAFANEGSTVIVNHRNSEAEAKDVLVEVNKNGKDNLLIKADVSREEEVISMFKQIKVKYGKLDILVNNAGYSVNEKLLETEFKHWHDEMDNNFFNTVLCSKEFLKISNADSLRKIINISSIYGFGDKSSKNYMAYAAAKAAVNNFTQLMAKNYAPAVLVNAIAPGYVYTPLWGEMSEEEKQKEGNDQLIQRMIEPSEIAEGAVFLAKNDSMTGTILVMDGGIGLKTV